MRQRATLSSQREELQRACVGMGMRRKRIRQGRMIMYAKGQGRFLLISRSTQRKDVTGEAERSGEPAARHPAAGYL